MSVLVVRVFNVSSERSNIKKVIMFTICALKKVKIEKKGICNLLKGLWMKKVGFWEVRLVKFDDFSWKIC